MIGYARSAAQEKKIFHLKINLQIDILKSNVCKLVKFVTFKHVRIFIDDE